MAKLSERSTGVASFMQLRFTGPLDTAHYRILPKKPVHVCLCYTSHGLRCARTLFVLIARAEV